jgi:uncharacterized oligopeptide transporter (OPT) family protein
MTPIFLGGLLRWWAERSATGADEANERRERGILLGSGFVGGEGLIAFSAFATWFYLQVSRRAH